MDDFMEFDAEEMAVVLGMAEEISSSDNEDHDKEADMLSLFIDSKQSRTNGKRFRKPAPKHSFEAWIRDVCTGKKSIDDPL